jgi:hypothetical protein
MAAFPPRTRGESIFRDVGALYGLRSKLVHGGDIKESDLRKIITGVSMIPDGALFGVAVAFAVDRLRDLVRRSFLARGITRCGTTSASSHTVYADARRRAF